MTEPVPKRALRRIRSLGTFWIAEPSMEHLEAIRTYELGVVLEVMPPEGRLLEIGAGTGWQARGLANRGYDVSAIDLPCSNYKANRIWPITEYDGHRIPYSDDTFDIVFSSNTLLLIPHVFEFQEEIRRVLKPHGLVIHVLPSSSWRFWTNLTHLLKCWTIPRALGEQAGDPLTEIYYLSRRWWVRLFTQTGWKVVAERPNRLFYTGHLIMDSRLSIGSRSRLSRTLGSSCNIFVMRNEAAAAH